MNYIKLLIQAQGLDTNGNGTHDADLPQLCKHTTMNETCKEGVDIIDRMGGAVDCDAKTRAQQKHIDDASNGDTPKVSKVYLNKKLKFIIIHADGNNVCYSM